MTLPLALIPMLILTTLPGESTGAAAGHRPNPHEIVYAFFRNGKEIGETTGRLAWLADTIQLESVTEGTSFMTRMLGLTVTDRATIEWTDEGVQPRTFFHELAYAGPDRNWTAEFDHQAGTVRTENRDGMRSHDLEPGMYDPGSLQLALRLALAAGVRDWPARKVDEDGVDEHRYVAGDPVRIDTALGCRTVVPVERIREGSSRYVNSWHDPEHEFLPLRIVQGKRGGDEHELQVRRLSWDGQPVAAGPPCDNEEDS